MPTRTMAQTAALHTAMPSWLSSEVRGLVTAAGTAVATGTAVAEGFFSGLLLGPAGVCSGD